MDNEKSISAMNDLLDTLKEEIKKEPISPERVSALAQAISALTPLILTKLER